MTGWVECRSIGIPGKLIYVNLSQVISLMATERGIAIVGSDGEEFVVEGTDPKTLIYQARTGNA